MLYIIHYKITYFKLNIKSLDVIYVVYKHYEETIYSIRSLKSLLTKLNLTSRILVFDNSFNISSKLSINNFISFASEISNSEIFVEYIPSNKNIGFGSACNKASKKVTSNRFLICNCDTSFINTDPEKFMDLLNNCDSKNVIVGPKIVNEKGLVHSSCFSFDPISILFKPLRHVRKIGKMTRYIPEYKSFKKRIDRITYEGLDKDSRTIVDWISGCCFVVQKNFFEKVEGFDDNFFLYFEDVDICRKAKQLGLNVLFDPMVSVIHKGRHESRNKKGVFNSIARNQLARYHISSWIKYMFKWKQDFLKKLIYVTKRISKSNKSKTAYNLDFSKYEPLEKKK